MSLCSSCCEYFSLNKLLNVWEFITYTSMIYRSYMYSGVCVLQDMAWDFFLHYCISFPYAWFSLTKYWLMNWKLTAETSKELEISKIKNRKEKTFFKWELFATTFVSEQRVQFLKLINLTSLFPFITLVISAWIGRSWYKWEDSSVTPGLSCFLCKAHAFPRL